VKKILVIKHGSLGDIIFSLDAMSSIRKKYPDSLIHLLTEKQHTSFFSKTKFFDKIIVDNRKDFLFISFLNLLKLLKENFDLIIYLKNFPLIIEINLRTKSIKNFFDLLL